MCHLDKQIQVSLLCYLLCISPFCLRSQRLRCFEVKYLLQSHERCTLSSLDVCCPGFPLDREGWGKGTERRRRRKCTRGGGKKGDCIPMEDNPDASRRPSGKHQKLHSLTPQLTRQQTSYQSPSNNTKRSFSPSFLLQGTTLTTNFL